MFKTNYVTFNRQLQLLCYRLLPLFIEDSRKLLVRLPRENCLIWSIQNVVRSKKCNDSKTQRNNLDYSIINLDRD